MNLFIARSIYPAITGGPSNSIYQLAKSLGDSEICASNIALEDSDILKYSIKLGLSSSVLGQKIWFFRAGKIAISFRMAFWLFKNVKRFKYVHLPSYFAPISLLTAFICVLRGVNFIVYPRGELFSPALSDKTTKKQMFLPIIKLLYHFSSAYVATSKEEVGTIKSFGVKQKIILSPNFYDFHTVDDVAYSSGDKYFLFLGRLNPIKNIDIIIRAYKLYKDNFDSSIPFPLPKLFIAGKGEPTYIKELQDIVQSCGLSSNVVFLGHITGSEKDKLIANAFYLLLMSRSENFGNVVIEALAHGSPVIASKGTPWEVLNDVDCGYWIDSTPNDLLFILNKVTHEKESSYLDKRIRSKAFARINYSSEVVIEGFKKQLLEI